MKVLIIKALVFIALVIALLIGYCYVFMDGIEKGRASLNDEVDQLKHQIKEQDSIIKYQNSIIFQ